MRKPAIAKDRGRVVVKMTPASAMLYSDQGRPVEGAHGTVTSIPLPGGRNTWMAGPGGGLVYVKFDDGSTLGVSALDLVREGKGAKAAAAPSSASAEDLPIPKGQIEWIVGNMHVATDDAEVAQNIRRRTKKWPPAKIDEAVAYALEVHHKNRGLYSDVMSGRIGAGARERRAPLNRIVIAPVTPGIQPEFHTVDVMDETPHEWNGHLVVGGVRQAGMQTFGKDTWKMTGEGYSEGTRENPLSATRFFGGASTFRVDGRTISAPVFSYESQDALYDVAVFEGKHYYRTNMGPWTTEPTKVHLEIEKHFERQISATGAPYSRENPPKARTEEREAVILEVQRVVAKANLPGDRISITARTSAGDVTLANNPRVGGQRLGDPGTDNFHVYQGVHPRDRAFATIPEAARAFVETVGIGLARQALETGVAIYPRVVPAQSTVARTKAKEIWVRRGEGNRRTDDMLPHTFTSKPGESAWKQADRFIREQARTVREKSRDKTDFKITYTDGETYEGRLDLSREHAAAADPLGEHMTREILFRAGKWKPAHMSEEQYRTYLESMSKYINQAEFQRFFDTYEVGEGMRENPVGAGLYPSSPRGTQPLEPGTEEQVWNAGYETASWAAHGGVQHAGDVLRISGEDLFLNAISVLRDARIPARINESHPQFWEYLGTFIDGADAYAKSSVGTPFVIEIEKRSRENPVTTGGGPCCGRNAEWRARRIILEPEVVTELYSWHGGQSDPVYALASWGQHHYVSLSMIDAATTELERVLHRQDPPNGKLAELLFDLGDVRQYWAEHQGDETEGYDERDYGMSPEEEAAVSTRSS
jgi:hypothetical protein